MKTIIALGLFASLTSAFAAQYPDRIVCTSGDLTVKYFDLNSSEADTDLEDTSFDPDSSGDRNGTFNLAFSNGCDNLYNLTLATAALVDLGAGRVSSIPGKLYYFSMEGSSTDGDLGDDATCTLLKGN